jgi:hypothetical protein
MKLVENPISIEQIGTITEASSFKMKSSRKAFQILSDLYSDKPLAIVRELGCNASDSMTASGKADKPFHIHLPNSLEPWLTIQDFGTGISHQNIYDIYSTYFESTKTNTNDQIGCLGLGSKSPFCYADNFSVTSIHDGVKRIYNAYFAQDGNPTIAMMSQENTSDENGIAIQIPVKEKDFFLFINAVQKAFRFFDVKPTITGASLTWPDNNPMFKGDDWMFYDNNQGWESFAIMGGVTYPIDHYKTDDKYNQILRKGVVLKFKMGELDFAPSREHLSYDDSTIKALNDKLEKVIGEIAQESKNQILAKDNILEAMRALQYFNDRFSYYGKTDFEIKNLIYKGLDITQPYAFLKTQGSCQHFYLRSYRKSINENTSFSLNKGVTWYYDDGQVKNPIGRVKAFVRSGASQDGAILISKDTYDRLALIGFPDGSILPASSLPSPTSVRKSPNGSVVVKAKEDVTIFNFGDSWKVSWESKLLKASDPSVPKYYLIKDKTWNLDISLKNLKSITDKNRLNHYLTAFGLTTKDVVMVGVRDEAKLKARGCKSLVDHINTKDFSWVDFNEVATINHYRSNEEAVMKNKGFSDLTSDNPIVVMLHKLKSLRVKYNKIDNLVSYLKTYDCDKTKHEEIACKAHQYVLENLLTGWNNQHIPELLLVAKAMQKN